MHALEVQRQHTCMTQWVALSRSDCVIAFNGHGDTPSLHSTMMHASDRDILDVMAAYPETYPVSRVLVCVTNAGVLYT